MKEILNLIQEEKNRMADTASGGQVSKVNFFKQGRGYVDLTLVGGPSGDTLAKYHISPVLSILREKHPDASYPPYYTYVGTRLVLVYVPVLDQITQLKYSSKSKKKLRKRMKQFLDKPREVIVYDLHGKPAFQDRYFPGGSFKRQEGKYVYVLKNKPPLVVVNEKR